MSKQKFDLSNVGGQPKGWMQKEHEKEVASRPLDGWKIAGYVALIGLLVSGGLVLLISGLFLK
jgi:hypothetical protein